MFEILIVAFEAVRDFMELGGWVLYVIGLLLIVMWFLILERIMYLRGPHRAAVRQAIDTWEARSERRSWNAHRVREKLISSVSLDLGSTLPMIQACVALCPLLGLLGTVTGMIEVFQVMALNGTSNARAMAGGVSKATVPTMAGMVAALSALFVSFWLQRQHARERELLDEHMTLDH